MQYKMFFINFFVSGFHTVIKVLLGRIYRQFYLSYIGFFFGMLMIMACREKTTMPLSTANNTNTAHTYEVSPSGSDANAGTIINPLRGINTALSIANPGDTVIVRTGTYYEKVS